MHALVYVGAVVGEAPIVWEQVEAVPEKYQEKDSLYSLWEEVMAPGVASHLVA